MVLPFARRSRAPQPRPREGFPVTVADVMAPAPTGLSPDATFPEIVAAMLAHNRSVLPVLDPDGALLGVVSDADLIAAEAFEPRLEQNAPRCARDLMDRQVEAVAPADDAAAVARRMLAGHRHELPVVAAGRLAGWVSRADLLKPLHRTDEDIRRDVEAVLADPRRVPYGHTATARVDAGVVRLSGATVHPSDIRVLCAAVARVPGVIGVESGLHARFPEPHAATAPAPQISWT